MGFRKELMEEARRLAERDVDIFPIFIQLLLKHHRHGIPTLYGDTRATGL